MFSYHNVDTWLMSSCQVTVLVLTIVYLILSKIFSSVLSTSSVRSMRFMEAYNTGNVNHEEQQIPWELDKYFLASLKDFKKFREGDCFNSKEINLTPVQSERSWK